ncbi:MAG TPA: hypothetical protein VMU28_14330 [Terriglobales bacterium]|nr:hypothetical protein [Terriglobales bacterium]
MFRVMRHLMMTAAFLACSVPAFCQNDAQELVSTVVNNELHSQNREHYWMYLDRDTTQGKTELKRVLQQPECWFRWPIEIDDHPVSPQERENARRQIDDLVTNPAMRDKDRKQIDQDASKAKALLKILPDAFLFTSEGQQREMLVFKFRPNPNYDPPTREAKVFHAMAGTLFVNKKENRLEKLTGTLTHNVQFGWGILGKIHKGGTFEVEQSEEAPGDWELTLLNVHISGKALFFHAISEQQHEVMTDFEAVPAGIGLQQAAKMVEESGSR